MINIPNMTRIAYFDNLDIHDLGGYASHSKDLKVQFHNCRLHSLELPFLHNYINPG